MAGTFPYCSTVGAASSGGCRSMNPARPVSGSGTGTGAIARRARTGPCSSASRRPGCPASSTRGSRTRSASPTLRSAATRARASPTPYAATSRSRFPVPSVLIYAGDLDPTRRGHRPRLERRVGVFDKVMRVALLPEHVGTLGSYTTRTPRPRRRWHGTRGRRRSSSVMAS